MPDIFANLKKTIDGETAPQHLKHQDDEFEFSEGSDGAIHSKIVDQNGNPIDPRQVSDADALTELQELKQKQQEIDNKIQQLVEGQGNVNFPDNQPVSDADVLQAIQALQQENTETKQMVNSILERLDGTFNTQLTGSNVEQDVIIAGGRRDEITLLPREVRQSGDFTTFNVPSGVSSILIVHVVYQVSGSFSEDEGHRFTVAPFEGSAGRVLFRTWHEYRELMDHHTGNSSTSNGSYTYMFNPYAEEMPNPRQNVLIKIPVVFNDMRITLSIDGHFEENEGIDSEVICRFNY